MDRESFNSNTERLAHFRDQSLYVIEAYYIRKYMDINKIHYSSTMVKQWLMVSVASEIFNRFGLSSRSLALIPGLCGKPC
jgi:hypothetical protein